MKGNIEDKEVVWTGDVPQEHFTVSPFDEVLAEPAEDVETLLKVRAWEVKESPTDLGYKLVEDWPKIPKKWNLTL